MHYIRFYYVDEFNFLFCVLYISSIVRCLSTALWQIKDIIHRAYRLSCSFKITFTAYPMDALFII